MSDVSSDLGGIRAGPVERDIEQVRAANPSLGGSISPPPVPGSTARPWFYCGSNCGREGQIIVYRLRALRPRGAELQASSRSLCADVKWCLIPAEFMGVDAVVCCFLLLLCYNGAQTGYSR